MKEFSLKVRVVLVEPEHEGNVGSIARLMKNFDLSNLWLVNPKVEIGNGAYSLAVHAGEVLEKASIVEDLGDALEGVKWVVGTTSIVAKKPGNLRRTAITLEELAEQRMNGQEEVALLFGREGSGLSNRELDRCDVVVSIPSSSTYRALNVASAAAIVFYELRKAEGNRGERGYLDEADPEIRERILRLFDALAMKVGTPNHKRRLADKAFKNIVSRAFISKREAVLIVGVLRRAVNF
jgi:TrmH family RNA methyltransferase